MISSSKTKIYIHGGQVMDIPIIGRRENWYMLESPKKMSIDLFWFLSVNPYGLYVSGLNNTPIKKSDLNEHKK
jgi:hypothetical protein